MNRPRTTMLMTFVLLALAPAVCRAATGDVSFRAADKTLYLTNSQSPAFTMDVFFEVENLSSVPAIGWGMIVNVIPQTGATGSVRFSPPPIMNNQSNLAAASQSAFLDFDRDANGMSYGQLSGSETRLNAFSTYVAPTLHPAPPRDANGNVTLPSGSGLVTLPLVASADASGRFAITFDPDPEYTGVVFATSQPPPDDVDVYPVGQHTSGIVNLIRLLGDYNRNNSVDAADYVLWRKGDLSADGNSNGMIDSSDYTVSRRHFGQPAASGAAAAYSSQGLVVPEPHAAVLAVAGLLILLIHRCDQTPAEAC